MKNGDIAQALFTQYLIKSRFLTRSTASRTQEIQEGSEDTNCRYQQDCTSSQLEYIWEQIMRILRQSGSNILLS